MEQVLQRVVRLGAPAQRLGEARRADRREHELLEIDVAVGVRAAVQDVHQRQRQHVRAGAADVAVQRQLALVGRGLRRCQRHAEHRVGAEAGLGVGAVEGDERFVDEALVEAVEPEHGVGDLAVHVLDGPEDALPAVALAAVAQLEGLVGAGARPARDSRPPARAGDQLDLDLDGRIAAGVQYLPGDDLDDGAHRSSGGRAPPPSGRGRPRCP